MILKKSGLCFLILALLLPSFTCYADTVSMSFSNVPVGYLFQNLGRIYGVSFAVSSVAAAKTVSVELTDVEFNQALDMIASSAGVTITRKDDKLYIVRAAEEETEGVSKEEKTRKEQETRLKGAMMEAITTKFVNAVDVQKALEKIFGEDFKSLVSVSQLSEDEKSRNYNSLVIYASSKEVLETVKSVVAQIDKPKPMVEMEALFVELSINDNKDLGPNWTIMSNPLKFQEEAPAQNPDNDPMKYYTARFGTFWRVSPWEAEATLNAIAGTGRGRVLANPKVRVMSGKKALFVSETQVPIITRDADGDINTDWKNVGISLEILPVVLDDGTIYMNVIPKASSIVGEKRLGEVSAPIISERRVETEMFLNPGEMVVIGGLINDRDIKNLSKVPILGDIPLFGELFKNTRTEKERSTVVVLLKPVIIEDYMGANIPEKLKHEWEKTTVEIKPLKQEGQKEDAGKAEIEKFLERIKEEQKPVESSEKQEVAVSKEATQNEKPEGALKEEKGQSEKPAKTPKSDEEYTKKWQDLLNEYSKKQPKEQEKQSANISAEEKVKEKEEEKESKEEKDNQPKEPDGSKNGEKGQAPQGEDKPKPEDKPKEDTWVPPVK